ncbi:MAG: hypothetical protein RLZZ540_1991 [Bacteroidota bacterium]|jgi:protein TonB
MKKALILVFFSFFVQINFAQGTDTETSSVVAKAETDTPLSTTVKSNGSKEKESSKGMKLYNYISDNYRLPNVPGLKGRVVVSFVINEDGSIGDFKIVEDLGYGTAEELIRVLKTTQGKWKPGIENGKPVKVNFSIPLTITVP